VVRKTLSKLLTVSSQSITAGNHCHLACVSLTNCNNISAAWGTNNEWVSTQQLIYTAFLLLESEEPALL
jgi:hypothetical protein